MLLWLATACLFDRATYEARLAELTDADGDGVAALDDCDDADPGVYPGASETCDGHDDDCDGDVDEEAAEAPAWYNDADADGHGLASTVERACGAPAGFVADGTDCDDGDAARNPDATEVPYDGVDQDCSGADLEDVDGDGYAALLVGGPDCDDDDAAVYPSADETWDNGFVDNDCDGHAGASITYDAPTWTGSVDGGQLGYTLGPLGDVDGDGRDEFWASSLFDGTAGEFGGRAWIIDSATAGNLGDATSFLPDRARTFLGVAMAAGPDASGDSASDIAVAGDGFDEGRGALWLLDVRPGEETVLPGSARAEVRGSHPSTYLGHAVALLPDYAGDGQPLLAVAVPNATVGTEAASGRVLLYDWAIEGSATEADADGSADGYYAGGQFGVGVASAGDVDGDGLSDWLVRFSAGDLAVVLPGGSTDVRVPDDALFRVTGSGSGETGECTLLGDVDADERPDLGCGSAEGFWIFMHLLDAPLVVPDDATSWLDAGGERGRVLVDLGDRDGDGRDETWLTSSDGVDGAGHAGILLGSTAASTPQMAWEDLGLLAVPDLGTSRYGFTSALLESEGTLLLGGPSRDAGGTDRGAIATLPLPR